MSSARGEPANRLGETIEVQALIDLDPGSISRLSSVLMPIIRSLPGVYLLTREDIEELRNDVILVTIRRLQEGAKLFEDSSVTGYARGVAWRLLGNRLKAKKNPTMELNDQMEMEEFNVDQYLMQKEREKVIGQLLKNLGGICEKIIRLKYFENMRDQEVVDRQLVAYSNVDSLKSKRCSCLKKLTEMVQQNSSGVSDLKDH